MKVGLIDVDGHNFPNLPLMKLSAWHKQKRDSVEWYSPMFSGHLDRVYMSKVFGFTPDYEYYVNAEEILRGGTGYAIEKQGGNEVFIPERDHILPDEIEHIYPDYSLYQGLTKDTAYGFLTRGCPRNCGFCHTTQKDGCRSRKVADLSEFWAGQKNVVLLDQNILACPEHQILFDQLVDSGARVEFNGGLDIRLICEKDVEELIKIRLKCIHFAFDRFQDRDLVTNNLKMVREMTGWDRHKVTVYVLVNYDTTLEQDLERIYEIRDIGFMPYVMIYDKGNTRLGETCRRLQRWVNNPWVFARTRRFEEYA